MKIWHIITEDNELMIEWGEENRRFGLWFDDKDSGWYFAEINPPENTTADDICGSMDNELLEKMYDKIGKILGK